MSFLDLATLTMHRRNELEGRLNIFYEKCDRAIEDIKKLKAKTQGFVLQLNCEPSELKERFLSCMKQLDEYMYLITDFNLAIGKIEETGSIEYTPVLDTSMKLLLPTPATQPFNIIDTLSEPTPSTSTACSNHCPPEKPKRIKVPRKDQTLIVFSSSSSEETVQQKTDTVTKEVQCDVAEDVQNIKLEDYFPVDWTTEECDLPAQTVLEVEQVYEATIMHVDGPSIWLITGNPDEVQSLMVDMSDFYHNNHQSIVDDVTSLTCCAYYDDDSDCYYRGLFLKLTDTDDKMAAVFTVDTGEIRCVPRECLRPLHPRYCDKPPYARCCHLAGVDLLSSLNRSMTEKQEEFMRRYIGAQCTIEVDDNTSESLGVYVVLNSGETLNEMIVQEGLAIAIDKLAEASTQTGAGAGAGAADSELDITHCPEYEDPVVAVTGYHNRDEADICKHYKGGPEKTCFKGARCNKKHIVKHPDGWTLDRCAVPAKCRAVALPAPATWHRVLVTCVCHFDRLYVQFQADDPKQVEEPPSFGVVMSPRTLAALVRDMNSPAARCSYKPLQMIPAPGEMVAALYPLDGNWYRARVMSITRADQNVELMYVDYGTVLHVKEDQVCSLEARYLALPLQAARCVLAGVSARSACSQQWAAAKRALADMVQDQILDVHIIAREYDEVVVELYDKEGYSIAEQLAARNLVNLTEYSVVDDTHLTTKLVVP